METKFSVSNLNEIIAKAAAPTQGAARAQEAARIQAAARTQAEARIKAARTQEDDQTPFETMENQALKTLIGLKVWNIEVEDYQVRIALSNATNILITMQPECCECLYFKTDDDLRPSGKGRLINIELAEGGSTYAEPEESNQILESAFLRIITDQETFTIQAYNEHNGYYSGFKIHLAVENLELKAWRQADKIYNEQYQKEARA